MKTANRNIIKQILIMIGICMSLLLCIVLPFLPRDFDTLATPISLTVQTFSIIGLITCFPAFFWLYNSIKNRNKAMDTLILSKQKKFAKIYVYTFFVAFFPIVLMTILTLSLSFGISLLIGLIISAKFTLKRIAFSKQMTPPTLLLPLFLSLLPILLLAFQLAVDKPLTDWSRNKAMANSKVLIDEIESWKTKYGKYPPTLNAVHKDYSAGIRGIEKYHYANDNTTYNLYFEQPKFLLDQFGTREFVVYNPSDNHLMISHASWNARWEPEQLRMTQGWYASGNAGHTHWKYFWFD